MTIRLGNEVEFIHGSANYRIVLRRALEEIDAIFDFAAFQRYITDSGHVFPTITARTALPNELIVHERLFRCTRSSSRPFRKSTVRGGIAVRPSGCSMRTSVHLHNWNAAIEIYVVPPVGRYWNRSARMKRSFRPTSYAVSNYGQEEIALKLGRRYSIASVALRYPIVQGSRQSFYNAYSGALRSFAVRVLTERPPVLYEDGLQLRGYISVRGVVRTNLLVPENPLANDQVFNVGGNRLVTTRDLAELVIKIAGARCEPEVPRIFRLGDARHIVSDVTKLRRLVWVPEVDLGEHRSKLPYLGAGSARSPGYIF